MKKWSKEEHGYIWIPSVITLPIGMLYPIDVDSVEGIGEVGDMTTSLMKWAFAPMIDIDEKERENYPDGNGGFYKKRINTDNPEIFDNFIFSLSHVNDLMKKESLNETTKRSGE